MSKLSLKLLGPVRVSYHLQPIIKFSSSNAQALLIYLAVEHELGSSAHRRQALMELLWQDTLPQSAQANLRQTVYKLRQSIPTVTNRAGDDILFILSDRKTVELDPNSAFDLDVAAFLRLAAGTKPTQQAQAIDLYRGDFLADFSLPASNSFEMWAEEWRGKLRRTSLEALASLADHALQNAVYDEAERYSRRQLAIDNLREQGHHQLMTALSRSRRGHEAITHYEEYSHLLQTELGISPSNEITSLAEGIRRGEEATLPEGNKHIAQPSGTGESGTSTTITESRTDPHSDIPHNMPTQTIPFVGRQAELNDLSEMMVTVQKRLITITGPGGIGKTRLALAAAEHQLTAHTFHQGVFIVPLAGLSESEHIVPAIAEAIQLRLSQGEKQLLAYLRTKQLLLVLDNFEHLMDGSNLVVRILQAAPNVQILITSRERLRLQGEQVYPIHGLPMDEEGMMEDAIQLFLQAALRIRPDFQQTSENLPILNQICRLVEGMPLALELAAAWVDLLSPEDIAAEIQRSLEFLETDLRDMPDRHRSIRAVFDTSWQNLSTNTQKLLAHVSVFRGGFTREAVTIISQASLRDLGILVDKSLLRFDPTTNRYVIHELLRQYGAEKLAEDRVDENKVRERHSRYFCDWFGEREGDLMSSDPQNVLKEIQAEIENVRTACLWAAANRRVKRLFQTINGLGLYSELIGDMQGGFLIFHQITEKLSDFESISPPDDLLIQQVLARIYGWQSQFYGLFGKSGNHIRMIQKSQALVDALTSAGVDSRSEQAFIYRQLGYVYYWKDPNLAIQYFTQGLDLHKEIGHHREMPLTLIGMGRTFRNMDALKKAKEAFTQSLDLSQEIDFQYGVSESQSLLGWIANVQGYHEEAELYIRQALASEPVSGSTGNRLCHLGYALGKGGKFQEAIMRMSEGIDFYRELGIVHQQQAFLAGLGWIYLHLGKYQEARDQVDLAQTLQKTGTKYLSVITKSILGSLALANKLYHKAAEIYQESLVILKQGIRHQYVFQQYLGLAYLGLGRKTEALEHFKRVLQWSIKNHLFDPLLEVLLGIALMHAENGEPERCIELYAQAAKYPYVANSHWFEDIAGKKIATIAAELPPDVAEAARVRGREMDLWEIANRLVDEN